MTPPEQIFLRTSCQHCGGHIEYPLELRGEQLQCPHCREWTKLGQNAPPPVIIQQAAPPPVQSQPQTIYVKEKTKTGCLTWVVAVFLGFLLIGFIASLWETSNSKTGGGTSGSSSSGDPAVSLSQVKGAGKQYGGIEITGIIENKTSRTLDRMFVRYSIYDKQGNKVSEASDFIAQLEPSGTWKFSATSSAKEAETFSLDGISCKHGGLMVEEK